MSHNLMTFTAVAVFFLAGTPILQGQPATSRAASVSESELPYNQQPISYSERTPDDAISRLQNQLDEGEIKIKSTGKQGFLLDLLRALDIPISSQLLVFSKSSANARLITPQSPRAVYFNDDVYVGWVPGSAMIEISAVDPIAGGMFYHLKQSPDQNDVAAPLRGNSIQRDESCLLCHISRNSLRVPGHLVRSFTTDSEGQMRTGWSRVTHDTPYYNRWAGWYVTGEVGRLKHLGNVYGDPPEQKILIPGDLKRYLAATSDVVPHLVLEHQAQGHNLITRLNYEARLSIPITAADPLLRYLLFVDEAPLTTPVRGILDYQKWFEARGPRDNQGRSLRQFDLQTRMFKYRMSFLIYSAAFDALPDPIRLEFFRDLKSWLTTTDAQHPATRLPIDERQAILQILRETKPGLPKDW